MNTDITAEIAGQLAAHRLPRWQELPDLALYMDQVVGLIDRKLHQGRRHLGGYPGHDARGLTASMVNNYVKLGIMPAPQKKKYTREHLAYLIIICILKASLTISDIQRLMDASLGSSSIDAVYDRFCGMFEDTNRAAVEEVRRGKKTDAVFPEPLSLIFHAALRAQTEQALAARLVISLSVAAEEKNFD